MHSASNCTQTQSIDLSLLQCRGCLGKATGSDKKLFKTLNASYEALSKSPTTSMPSTSPFGPLTDSASRKVSSFSSSSSSSCVTHWLNRYRRRSSSF